MNLDRYLHEIETAVSFAARLTVEGHSVSPGLVHQWRRDLGTPTPKQCVTIEKVTNGVITRKELRGDWREIWPELIPASEKNIAV